MSKRLLFITYLVMLVSGAATAQSLEVGVELSPVPIWPKDGVVPAELQHRYVFLDPEANQLVLAFPASLGSEESESAAGALQLRRIDLANQVSVSLSVSVERKGSEFEYRYRAANHGRAVHAVRQLQLTVPISDEQDHRVVAPTNWLSSVIVEPGRGGLEYNHPLAHAEFPDPFNGSHGMVMHSYSETAPLVGNFTNTGIFEPSSSFLHWYVDDDLDAKQTAESVIHPSSERDGFIVHSPLRPGITTVYSYGMSPSLFESDVPSVVRAQAEPMLRHVGQPTFTVGPTFSEYTSRIEIVAAYHLAFQRLIRHGRLSESSVAVREALAAMEGYFEYIQVAYAGDEDISLEKIDFPPLMLSESPRPGFEAEVLHALELSMSE